MESRDIKTEGEASNGSLISALTTVKRVSDIDSVRQDKENKTKRQREREEKPRERRRKRRKQKPEDNHQYQFLIQSLELDGVNIGGAIRKVEPYPFTYTTFCKARWIGKSLLDIYHSEFGAYPRTYYESCIRQGRIRVGDKTVDPSYLVKGGDALRHTVHRHEPAVWYDEQHELGIAVIADEGDVIVVDKPGTVPVHPCGGYHQNSLLRMLQPKYGKLYNVNRLDRLTSGLVVVAKSSAVATKWGRSIMGRSCEKIYLARVQGKFPLKCDRDPQLTRIATEELPVDGEWQGMRDEDCARKRNAVGYWITTVDGRLSSVDPSALVDVDAGHYKIDEWIAQESNKDNDKGTRMFWLHLACPTRVAKQKEGVCEAGAFANLSKELYDKTVKAAQTSFAVLRYDEATDSTVVLCRPATGRSHQIRLHLQLLGHPIANDPNYGGEMWYNDTRGRDACSKAQNQLEALNAANASHVGERLTPKGATNDSTPATEGEINSLGHIQRGENESLDDFIQKTCVWCARSRGAPQKRDMLEFLVRSRGIWLHAYQYSMQDEDGKRHSYRTDPPEWSLGTE